MPEPPLAPVTLILGGIVPVHTVNVPAHKFAGDALLRGLGAPEEKSVELLSVSVQPLFALSLPVVLLGADALDVSLHTTDVVP